jgi:hypothetical protein
LMTWAIVSVGQWNFFIIARRAIPIVWPIQEIINLTQKEVIILEEVRFSFDHLHRNNFQSLFGSQSFSSSNSHVCVVSCHSLERLSDANYWPTIYGGKKVRQPFVFKLTQNTNNWEANILFIQCIVFPIIDVPPLGYGWIYNFFLMINNTMSLLEISLDVHVYILSWCW